MEGADVPEKENLGCLLCANTQQMTTAGEHSGVTRHFSWELLMMGRTVTSQQQGSGFKPSLGPV